MPILTIAPAALTDEALAMTAAHGLLALMIHPTDEQARRETIETLAVKDIGGIVQIPKDHKNYPLINSDIGIAALSAIKKRINYPESEARIVSEGRSYREVKQEMHSPKLHKQWQSVISLTAILLTLQEHHADFPGGISINKAVHLMDISPRYRKYGEQNDKDVRKAWQNYKNIAHILISYQLANAQGYDKDFIYTCAGLTQWLACARLAQRRILSVETKNNQQKRLIDTNHFWFIPDDLSLPSVDLEFPPLSKADLEKMGIDSVG